MNIIYKFASRSRPEKFLKVIENIYINCRTDNYTILASLDIDDTTMNNEDMIAKMKNYDKLYPVFGNSKSKVDAINRDMDKAPEWDILVNISDDFLFIENGFDTIILNEYERIGEDCLLHFPDQNQGENCMTMSIMDNKYYNRTGYIYYPGYESLWCDLEAAEVGKKLGKYHFINKRIFNHYHPSFGQAEYDEQYNRTESNFVRAKDEVMYTHRKTNNFFLDAP